MAFPGTYNFSYYKGDTLQFKIYPKDSSGASFDLTPFNDINNGSVLFTIANRRGASLSNSSDLLVNASAQILVNEGYILCTIKPSDGAQLTGGLSYVYDVEIQDRSGLYPLVYTILTGTVSVTEQVSTGQRVTLTVPQSLSVVSPANGSLTLNWTKPDQGNPNGYYTAYTPTTVTPLGTLTSSTAFAIGSTSITFTANTNLAVGNIITKANGDPLNTVSPLPTYITAVNGNVATLNQATTIAGVTTANAYVISSSNVTWLLANPITNALTLQAAFLAGKILTDGTIATSTTKTFTGLTHGTTYQVFVAATYDVTGVSAPTFGPFATSLGTA